MHFKEVQGTVSGKFLADEIMNAVVDIYEFYKYVMQYWDQIPTNFQLVFMLKIMKESYKLSESDRIEFEVWKDEYDKSLPKTKQHRKSCGSPKHPYYDEIMRYRKQGKTYREIGQIIGYSYQTVYNIANA